MYNNFKIISSETAGFPTIAIDGDLTSECDQEIKKSYFEKKPKDGVMNLIINFEKTKYINSSGIAVLISLIQDINETCGKLVFMGMSAHFKRVMDIVGVSDFVKSAETESEAIDFLEGR